MKKKLKIHFESKMHSSFSRLHNWNPRQVEGPPERDCQHCAHKCSVLMRHYRPTSLQNEESYNLAAVPLDRRHTAANIERSLLAKSDIFPRKIEAVVPGRRYCCGTE